MKVTLLSSLFILTAFALTSCSEQESGDDSGSESKNGHGHGHAPHEGVMVPFKAGQTEVGFVELKLHDDKGDLELWLTKDGAGEQPLDLPLNSVISITFPKMDYKIVKLRIRNGENNEDEDGNGNIRNGNTNYFIFPGDSGEDASFLMGKDFKTDATISFNVGGRICTTKSFKLSPHTH